MARSHIHRIKWLLPQKLEEPMKVVREAVRQLKESAGHEFLKFTLDGRLVGDLGEAIAEHFFAIKLHDSQQTGHDATLDRNKMIESVEVKTRRASTNIWFDSQPDQIIAFRLEEGDAHVTLVYAGPGSVLKMIRPHAQYGETVQTNAGATIRKFTARQTVSLNQLAEHFKYEDFMKTPSIPFRNLPTVA
jgi:hypothetical protein